MGRTCALSLLSAITITTKASAQAKTALTADLIVGLNKVSVRVASVLEASELVVPRRLYKDVQVQYSEIRRRKRGQSVTPVCAAGSGSPSLLP